jgi:tetratricopeptide (TPR) repeat protein
VRAASRIAPGLALLACALAAPAAYAGPSSAAEQTFQRGRALMAKKQFAEACAAFEQSQQLDPELGTLFNLADCDAQLGKVATAWKMFRELALTDPNLDRRKLSADAAKDLDGKLPRVFVSVPNAPAGTVLQLDGNDATALIGVATPVDVGAHAIAVSAPGFRAWNGHVDATIGHTSRIAVQLEPLAGEPPQPAPVPPTSAPPPPAPPPPEQPATTPPAPSAAAVTSTSTSASEPAPVARRGKLPMIVGASTIGLGLLVGASAYALYDHAESEPAFSAFNNSRQAVDLGDVSTGVVLVGAVVLGAGFYLWHSSGSAVTIAPQVGADHAGATLVGTF